MSQSQLAQGSAETGYQSSRNSQKQQDRRSLHPPQEPLRPTLLLHESEVIVRLQRRGGRLRKLLRPLSWNVGGMRAKLWSEFLACIQTDSCRYDVNMLQETHWSGCSHFTNHDWSVITSGSEQSTCTAGQMLLPSLAVLQKSMRWSSREGSGSKPKACNSAGAHTRDIPGT